MTYEDSVRYLLALGAELAAPRQLATGAARVAKFELRNITALCAALGQAHRAVPCAHIAGTNGKGSTAAMLDSILRAAGLRTGLYTSPHLERINERIRTHGEAISDLDFAAAFTRVHGAVEKLLAAGPEPPGLAAHPTYFECLTAMAFDFFARQQLDFAVFEVGMGGRLDATNIVAAEVCIITQIDFDHENYLGHSIEQIAGEKAGIIKPGVPVVSSAERPEARAVIARRAAELDAPLIEVDTAYATSEVAEGAGLAPPRTGSLAGPAAAGAASRAPTLPASHCSRVLVASLGRARPAPELTIPLAGRYQVRNALAALAAARVLVERGFPVDDAAIARGIATVSWPGRLELVQESPAVYLDGTHNPAGARELLAFWDEHFAGRRIVLVYGAVRDKAVDEITGLLFPRADKVILTAPRQPRAISAEALAAMAGHSAREFEVVADPPPALERAIEIARPDDAVFATGSLYLAGDLRRWWKLRARRDRAEVASPARGG